jgi:glucokinase
MTLLLVGDVGGTKTLLRLVEMPTGETATVASQQKNICEALYTSQEYPDLVPMVQEFFRQSHGGIGRNSQPRPRACFAIAGSGGGQYLGVNQFSLVFDHGTTGTRTRYCPDVSLINDFAAVGYGLLSLTAE